MFLRKKQHYQKDSIFKNMNMIITMNYRTSTRSGSYNKTQLTNDQIRSTWCIASRGNVWWYLKRFGTAEKKHENNVSKACIVTAFQTIWDCRERKKTWTVDSDGFWNDLELQRKNENNVSRACIKLWRYFKRFWTAAKKKENKDGKWCILTVFETIWSCRKE